MQCCLLNLAWLFVLTNLLQPWLPAQYPYKIKPKRSVNIPTGSTKWTLFCVKAETQVWASWELLDFVAKVGGIHYLYA